MRTCPACRQPLVREIREPGREIERCTNPNCGYHAWIVPTDQTRVTGPKYGNLWPADGVER